MTLRKLEMYYRDAGFILLLESRDRASGFMLLLESGDQTAGFILLLESGDRTAGFMLLLVCVREWRPGCRFHLGARRSGVETGMLVSSWC